LGIAKHNHSHDSSKVHHSKPVIFVSLCEHHSNLLPWRESGCEVVMIGLNEQGTIDIEELRNKLKQYSGTSDVNSVLFCNLYLFSLFVCERKFP
jgi:selenocysteine lyase/cysteine desulfurase